MVLLTILAATVIGITFNRNLFAVIVLSGVYSFVMATVLIVLDAVDVAMTEAAVGAGISMVLMLGALHLTKSQEIRPTRLVLLPLFVAAVTAGALVFGTWGLPLFGEAATPVHMLGPDYLSRSIPETGIPNVVTSVLASYRGFDTLGEVVVVFTAGLGVLLLLKRGPGRPRRHDDEAGP